MTIWAVTLLLLVFLASIGNQAGAIRMAVSMTGVLIAALLCFRMDKLVKPLVPLVGLSHPVWSWLLPPIVVFAVIVVVFSIAADVTHRKVMIFFKYQAEEEKNLKWIRLSSKLGLCLGVLMGAAYAILISLVVYVSGYWVEVFKPEAGAPAALRLLSRAYADLKSSGMVRIVASVDPTPESVYEAADILGLLYYNPDLRGRLADYPVFFSLAERPEFKELMGDPELSALIQNKADVVQLVKNPKVESILKNTEIMHQLRDLDMKDLRQFAETGRSDKFEKDKIVGRWAIDVGGTVAAYRKNNPEATPPDLRRIRNIIVARMTDMTLLFGPDGHIYLKASQSDVPQFAQLLSEKTTVLPRVLSVDRGASERVVMPGTWKKSGDVYAVVFQSSKGDKAAEVVLGEDAKLTLTTGKDALVFEKDE